MKFSNKHDHRRVEKAMKSLQKARRQLEEAQLYLTTNDRPPEEIFAVDDAHEHVLIALERLGVQVE